RRTVKQDAAVPIVHLLGYQLDVRMAFQIVLDELFLVGNAVALILMVFRVGKPQIGSRLKFRHKKFTPSNLRTYPINQRVIQTCLCNSFSENQYSVPLRGS